MANTTEVIARLQAALSTYDPTWDVSVGSATYKILEAVAQEIAYANNNATLQTYSYDINTKSGIDLDNFCNMFGVYRQQGKRAIGTVTFSINTPATNIYDIPMGSQVAVPIGTNYPYAINFTTIAPAIISYGETFVTVPVQASVPGSFANVPANTITAINNTLNGVTSVNNSAAMNGGTDVESDQQLRSRWLATAFNNTTGTPGKYVITALQNSSVTKANTVGYQNFYDENLQINATLSGTGSSGIIFLLIAYSGMTNVITGTTFSGTTVVASSGFVSTTTPVALASGLNAMISGVAPSNGITVSVTGSGTTIASCNFTINLNSPNPYDLVIATGTNAPGGGTTLSGVTTISGLSYYQWIQSNNSDLGVSGTLSFTPVNTTFTGYIFPQGNELIGTGVNSFNGVIYNNAQDYYYPNNPVAQLVVNIANGNKYPALFIGNNVEMVSEYNPASSRSTSLSNGNYVDIFINGTSVDDVTVQTVYNPTFVITSGNSTKYLNSVNYSVASGANMTAVYPSGDVYIPLDQQPAVNFPSQLQLSTNGVADSIYIYNTSANTGATYPISLNRYPYVTFTGTIPSGASNTNFIPVSGVNGLPNLFPGLALASGTAIPAQTWISSVSSSGIYLNNNITGNYTSPTGTPVVISGASLIYSIYDNTPTAYSNQQITGLAVITGTVVSGWPSFPTSSSWATYNYPYNSDVTTVDSLINQSKPVGANTLTHQATFINIIVNATVVLGGGYGLSAVQQNAINQIGVYLSQNVGYLGTVSFSSIASQFLNISGIANVRITSIQTAALDGTITNTFTKDFNLASNQLPTLYGINWTVKGASNF
jgi:Baseplate J-like protein